MGCHAKKGRQLPIWREVLLSLAGLTALLTVSTPQPESWH
jgi:hypothetical protein